jgi:plastocyanin
MLGPTERKTIMKPQRLAMFAAIAGVVLAACGSTTSAAPSDVTFDVQLIEVKGATDGIDPPDTDPATLSAGYGYTPPGEFDPENPDKWQVGTYMYSPGAMSVVQGDQVTLRIFGVNGDEHTMLVQAPDGSTVVESFTINRGREDTVNFTADQTGHYKIVCMSHAPTMTADILSIGG